MNEVSQKIAEAIRSRGAISFARFMELALYCPVYGYYEREKDTSGQRGDYYTSVSVGPLFGELLAFQFADWLAQGNLKSRRPEPLKIVEGGAHDGRLARDILIWMRGYRPELFRRLNYCIVEPSDRRQQWQARTLDEFADKVVWMRELKALAPHGDSRVASRNAPGVRGIIFANELLDAMPVHRLGWDAKRHAWFEWGVELKNGEFVWTRLGDVTREARLSDGKTLQRLPQQLLDLLPDRFTTEIHPAAEQWWREAADVLECGKLLAIDYGLIEDEFFAPQRTEGTVRAYSRHRWARDTLSQPGEQDITAQVNFTAIRQAGERVGLRTEAFLTQEEFLNKIAERIWKGQSPFGKWTPERTRQFQTLAHPTHLGRCFRVLVQQRGPENCASRMVEVSD